MRPLAAAGLGGLAGFAGAALAHPLVLWLGLHGGTDLFAGPHGPPFFLPALHTALSFGAVGASCGRRPALAGALAGFLGIFVPLYVLTRFAGLTPKQWFYLDTAAFSLGIWGSVVAVGAAAAPKRLARGMAAAVLGALAGYAVFAVVVALFPRISADAALPSFVPPPVSLLNGLLSGAGLRLALSLEEQTARRPS